MASFFLSPLGPVGPRTGPGLTWVSSSVSHLWLSSVRPGGSEDVNLFVLFVDVDDPTSLRSPQLSLLLKRRRGSPSSSDIVDLFLDVRLLM